MQEELMNIIVRHTRGAADEQDKRKLVEWLVEPKVDAAIKLPAPEAPRRMPSSMASKVGEVMAFFKIP